MSEREVQVKLLYTFSDAGSQQFVAKPPQKLKAVVDDVSMVGLVALQPCLDAILATSPELVIASDYAVYTVDYSEDGKPFQGHGRLSAIRAVHGDSHGDENNVRNENGLDKDYTNSNQNKDHETWIQPKGVGKWGKSPLYPDLLELEFKFSPITAAKLSDSRPESRPASRPTSPLRGLPPSSPPMASHYSSMPILPSTLQHHGLDVKAVPRRHRHPPVIDLAPGDLEQMVSRRAAATAPNSIQASIDLPELKSSGQQEDQHPKLRGWDKVQQQLRVAVHSGSIPLYCRNCGAIETSAWRPVKVRGENGDLREVPLCNACGLWFRAKGSMRPRKVWDKPRRRTAHSLHSDPEPSTYTDSPSLDSDFNTATGLGLHSEPLHVMTSSELNSELNSDPVREKESDIKAKLSETASLTMNPSHIPSEPESAITDVFTESLSTEPRTPSRANKENRSPTTPGSLDRLFWGEDKISQGKTPTPGGSRWMQRYLSGDPQDHSKMLESFLASPSKKKQRVATDSALSNSPSKPTFDIDAEWTMVPESPLLRKKSDK